MREYIDEIVRRANQAQASIYTVDARGLVATSGAGEARQRGSQQLLRRGFYTRVALKDITHPQEPLVILASQTGGLYVINSNDLERGMEHAFSDIRQYYLAGYVPRGERKVGRFYSIRVKVKRPGVQVRARKGYTYETKTFLSNSDLADIIRFPELFQAFHFEVEVTVRDDAVSVTTLIPSGTLRFAIEGEKYVCPIEVYGLRVGRSGGSWQVERVFSKSYELRLTAKQLGEILGHEHVTTSAVIQSRKKTELMVIVRIGREGRLATWKGRIR